MNRSELKKAIIDKCLQQLEDNYKTAVAEVNETQQAANEAGPPKDRYDPFRSQMLRRRNMFVGQCQNILKEIEIIKKIDAGIKNEHVSFGAVVITSGHKLFFAIPLGKIEVNKETYFVASTQTPLFEVMKNKSSGDSFEMNKNKFKILDIF
jgi:hypothetical protein